MPIDHKTARSVVRRQPALDVSIDSLLPRVSFDRRTFVKTALGTGFAAAVLPVSAQTIHTDTAGLEAGEVAFRVGGDWVPAYRAQPAADVKTAARRQGRLPVIIVVHEIFGVHEHIADVCRRFAKLGYLAIAPNLYSREGDAGAYPTMQQLNEQLVSKVPDEQVLGDLDAAVAWAGEHGGDLSRLGLTGFCWGGRIAWLYDERNPRLKAVVAWYGRVAGAHDPLHPVNPIDRVAYLHAPLLGLYGGQDPSIPQDTLARMRAAIASGPIGAEAARGTELIVYPNSPHAFFADYRPSYRKADAEDGWQRALAWFREHGVA